LRISIFLTDRCGAALNGPKVCACSLIGATLSAGYPMTRIVLIIVLTVLPVHAWAQSDAHADQAARVRTMVESFGQKKTSVTVLTRTLIAAKGKVIRSRPDSFDLKRGRQTTTVPYRNVLEMQGGGSAVSFVPEPAARNHGSWNDVGRIYPATRILVVYTGGKSAKGFSNSVSETHLIMIDEKGRERVDVPRDRIVAVYGLIGGYGGVKKGAAKGTEGMTGRTDLLPAGIFAGIGALVGLVKSDGRPVLIYSR
jgi:hypothetical protein